MGEEVDWSALDWVHDPIMKMTAPEIVAEVRCLRALCGEAAALYGMGGIFPVNGEMSARLEMAAQGMRLSRASGAQGHATTATEARDPNVVRSASDSHVVKYKATGEE